MTKTAGKSKKWQKMFRYKADREKAIKELVDFVYIVHKFAKKAEYSPDRIRDGKGGWIYL